MLLEQRIPLVAIFSFPTLCHTRRSTPMLRSIQACSYFYNFYNVCYNSIPNTKRKYDTYNNK